MAVRFLVKYGADITAHDSYGSTPMHYMSEVSIRKHDFARFRIEHCVNTKSQTTRLASRAFGAGASNLLGLILS